MVAKERLLGADHFDGQANLSGSGPDKLGAVLNNMKQSALILQPNWFLDANNGSDTADGDTASNALKSLEGLSRRFGSYPVFAQKTLIHLAGDFATEDFFLRGSARDGVTVGLIGEVTVTREGTITAKTNYLSGTNTAQITDTGVADWSPDFGDRLTLTSGANIGAHNWIAADLGSNEVRTNTWFKLHAIGEAGGSTPLNGFSFNVDVNDTYNIERFTSLSSLNISIDRTQGHANPVNSFEARDIALGGYAIDFDVISYLGTDACLIGCHVSQLIRGESFRLIGCHGSDVIAAQCNPLYDACMFSGAILTGSPGFNNCDGFLRRRTLMQGSAPSLGTQTTIAYLDGLAIYDSPIGFTVPVHSVVDNAGGNTWGTGNTTHGIDIKTGGKFIYDTKPTVTGSSGDVQVAGVTKTYAEIPFVNTAQFAGMVLDV